FQAEDGIRDFHVTGVQTCALPIWSTPMSGRSNEYQPWWSPSPASKWYSTAIRTWTPLRTWSVIAARGLSATDEAISIPRSIGPEIGRASWRERNETRALAVSWRAQ